MIENANEVVQIKICGLMEAQDAVAAASLGADMLGLVFAPSRRQVTPGEALDILMELDEQSSGPHDSSMCHWPVRTGRTPTLVQQGWSRPHCPAIVGVFVNQALDEVNAVAEACSLDYIQLSGDEGPSYCRRLVRPFIKALRMGPNDSPEHTATIMDRYRDASPEALFLLDTHVPGVYGGTGSAWEWDRAARLASRYPILIAGGLTSDNVAGAIESVRPWGVDVSSGVESDGIKDEANIAAFIEAVRG